MKFDGSGFGGVGFGVGLTFSGFGVGYFGGIGLGLMIGTGYLLISYISFIEPSLVS